MLQPRYLPWHQRLVQTSTVSMTKHAANPGRDTSGAPKKPEIAMAPPSAASGKLKAARRAHPAPWLCCSSTSTSTYHLVYSIWPGMLARFLLSRGLSQISSRRPDQGTSDTSKLISASACAKPPMIIRWAGTLYCTWQGRGKRLNSCPNIPIHH